MLTCVLPAKNEAGNLSFLIPKLVALNIFDKLIICVGPSEDDTLEVAKYFSSKYDDEVLTFLQSGKGKFNSIRESLPYINGSSIMIWDADGTVDIKSNLNLIEEFFKTPDCLLVGDRLFGKRNVGSMPLINRLGNYFFGSIWGIGLSGKPMDLFCGSKLFPKLLLEKVDRLFADYDGFGDLSLLFTANLLGMNIRKMPVEYLPRQYGKTNLKRPRFVFEIFLLTLIFFLKKIRIK